MNALEAAKRYLWLHGGPTTDDDPIELLRFLVRFAERYGVTPVASSETTALAAHNIKLAESVAQLEVEKRAVEKRLKAQVEQLEAQLHGDHLFKRVQILETKLKEEISRSRKMEYEYRNRLKMSDLSASVQTRK